MRYQRICAYVGWKVIGSPVFVLYEGVWKADPDEALIIQRWSPAIDLCYKFRVFIYKGKVNAISQDIW